MMPRTLAPAATRVIKAVNVAANHPVEPHAALKDVTRATTIFGRILEKIADDNFEQATPIARTITRLGLSGYSLVELSVPKSIPNLVLHYWIGLLRFVGVVMFGLGLFYKSPITWVLGAAFLLITWTFGGLSNSLRRFMQHRPFSVLYGFKQLSSFLLLLCACLLFYLFRETIGNWIIQAGQSIKNLKLP